MIVSYSMGVNFPQRSLASLPVVGALDPVRDRGGQLATGGPEPTVQNILLHQSEEGFHRCVIPT